MFKSKALLIIIMITFPNAKINIGLNILNRRYDGYHDLETILYPIKIHDALEIIEADQLSLESSGLEIPGNMADNLCIKGYQLIKKDFDIPPVKIHLHKNIPIGAGLGGGSADAAFFIKLMNQKFVLEMSEEQMKGYARQLGSDCAFFVKSEPVFAFEKGDEFEPIKLDLSGYHIAVVMPPVHVSTSEAYQGVKPAAVKQSLFDMIQLPIERWKHRIKNDFEQHIFQSHPVIRGVKAALYESDALYASMSGSGSSVFGIFEHKPDLSKLENNNKVFY